MARRGEKLLVAAAVLLLGITSAAAQDEQVNTIRDIFVRLGRCWQPPPPSKARPIDITVVVSFNRAGEILGHPRITYESKDASENDRLQYRVAVMEALQRCTPMPFTETMAGAAAGRPFAVQFHGRKTSPPTQERKA
ncbi:hypothetical protein NLM33_04890 [Bradyrhizobium sp. CCGUVB1N3]|uniref:hypothetical protein n=1 Tax=Bradyrhizobium sp. CCGUVB1N3 TaxID=2949629 RepID=UPI0020B1E213|nr:hypothetical protein [Bradyrhizobium sp. CCGUVB1N3]MCP3469665.1 hypothetical protein [Bradyrhizobium sp. CCGUVB1N3]